MAEQQQGCLTPAPRRDLDKDMTIAIEVISTHPKIYAIENALSDFECDVAGLALCPDT